MKYLTVCHATHYRYAQPVTLGPHRLMLRPRDSHDLRLVDAELTLSPPGDTRWMHDVFGNSVARVEFAQSANELLIVSTLHLEHYGLTRPVFPIAPEAQVYPFVYSADDRADLGRLLDRHYPDPNGLVDAWAKRFVKGRFMSTYNLLSNINGAIKNEFAYNARYEEGTQTPIETLERGSGTCRDFALLFMEAVRCLGSGATHAWADVYLPGAGWVEYDPTNGLIAGDNLIRIAVSRDPSQAIPIGGTFEGRPGEFLGMSVEVTVHASLTPHATMTPAESVQASPVVEADSPEQVVQPPPVNQADMSPQQVQSQNAQLIATVQPMQNA